MKYCPYCGVDLPEGAVSFCPECGNALPSKKKNDAQLDIEKLKPVKKKAGLRKWEKKAYKPTEKTSADETQIINDDYDGYYDDIRPVDEDRQWERIDQSIVKKIAMLIGCLVVIIGICVALMYLL